MNGFTYADFLSEFDDFVNEVSLLPGKLILLGDFNVHWDNPSKNDVIHFSSTTTAAGFAQCVNGPTHSLGHTLDLVFTRCDESDKSLLKDCYIDETCMSDHHIVCFTLQLPKPIPMQTVSTLRNYRKIDKNQFVNSLTELLSSKPINVDVDPLFEWYESGMEELLDTYAPATIKTRPVKNRMPWFNDSIHTARRERRRAERKWRKSRSDQDRELYMKEKRYVCELTETAKESYFKDKLASCSSKDVYRTINSLLNKKSNHLPFYDSAARLSYQFSKYFVEKIDTIRDQLDNLPVMPLPDFNNTLNDDIPSLEVLRPVSQSDLLKIITRSPSKSSRLDPIPTWFLKENIDHLLPVLTNIVNISLSSGIFPKGAHRAVIKPLLKNASMDKNNIKNYRPVSNLTYVGKLIEKVACSRLMEHVEANNLADPFQSAYRPRHSTETALIKVKNDIMFSLNSNKVILVVLLDLSAAFDTIDHHILVSRLSTRIGIKGTALKWFQSYLDGWSTQVDIAGELSAPIISKFGLPQGSVVGPVGFTIYTLPVSDITQHHNVSYHVYADDIQLYVSFDPKIRGELDCALLSLQNCICDIKNWMSINKLKLNDSKTEFFIAASPHNFRKLPDITLTIGNISVKPTDTIKNLGAFFDVHMSMNSHINNVSRTVTFHLRNISRIRRYIDQSTCHHAVRSLILSRLDYCNGLLSSLPKLHVNRLQRLQNWAARLVFEVGRSHSAQPLINSLHWLPIQQRIIFKLLLYVYKSLHHLAPNYLSNCLTLYTPSRNLRSSNDNLRLNYPITRVQAGDRTFTVAASKGWNNLPMSIRQSASIDIFKKALKTHLFT